MYALAIFLPLIAAAITGLSSRWIGDRAAQVARTKATSIEIRHVEPGRGI